VATIASAAIVGRRAHPDAPDAAANSRSFSIEGQTLAASGASAPLPLQTSLANSHSPSFALLVVIVPVLAVVIVLTALGSEDHSARFGRAEDEEARERFTTDRFTREGAPAPERLRT
jgi:hypothetical protein